MPNVNDLVSLAEALEKSPIAVISDRCVAVRNRNAKCRKCVQACPVQALEISENELKLNASACVDCGICCAVCPTEALLPINPTPVALQRSVSEVMKQTQSRAIFACARIASKRLVSDTCYAEVPCLSHVDEGAVLPAVAQGASEVLLVDGHCATCKYRKHVPAIDQAVEQANTLLQFMGSSVRVQRTSTFPEDLQAVAQDEGFGSSRRAFFSDAARSARDTAVTAAKATIAQELGIDVSQPGIGERLRVTDDGTLPQIQVRRHESILNSLDELGSVSQEQLDSRVFGNVTINPQSCNACGMCVVFCPTGALRRAIECAPKDPLTALEFSACDCVQCNLCADVCWKGAVTVSSSVSGQQLFDFEPVTFALNTTK